MSEAQQPTTAVVPVDSSSEKGHDKVNAEHDKKVEAGFANEELSPDILAKRVEAAGLDSVYERKVYILNKVMDEHIGMRKFQWQLFMLSGFGWFVDNFWLQGVAIILPQVSKEYGRTDVAWATFSLYIGLIFGAIIWGVLADVIGRRPAFNATLFIAGVFGTAAGGANSFIGLCGLLAAMGVGLGGNLPVDGMLFLEFIPGSHQWSLTLLSVFWSLGQLLASLLAWAFIVNFSCDGDNTDIPQYGVCIGADNKGWRYTFYTLGGITLAMWIARFFLFNLPESPKFLITKGRDAEAVAVLKEVAIRNGRPLPEGLLSVAVLRSAAGQDVDNMDAEEEFVQEKRGLASLADIPKDIMHAVKNFRLQSIKPDLSRVRPLFASPKLAYNTSCIFVLWAFIGLAYPLYNAFLPLYLQNNNVSSYSNDVSTVYSQYAYISICGVPGSIIAAFLVEVPASGRRGAMAIGTLLTGVFIFASTASPNQAAFLVFNCIEALTQNIMYGVLYAATPESFPAPYRGTGGGIASSLNRVFGAMAPIIRIYGGADNPNIPLFLSGALFLFCGFAMITLRIETRGQSAM